MKTFTFCSFKGGTSKTSTCLHLGACLAKFHNKRCLLVDFDPQANLSAGLGIGLDTLETMVPVLQGKAKIKDMIQETEIKNLSIIPSNAFLDGIERTSELITDPYAHERLRKALKDVEGEFDYCFIDTPPSLGWLTQSAFFASQHSIICSIPEAFSIIALQRLRDFHNSINEHHPLEVSGVLLSFWDERGAINKSLLGEVEKFFPDRLFNSKIRRDIAVSRAVFEGKPVFETSPTSNASLDYRNLTKEFLKRAEKGNPLAKLKEPKLEKSLKQ